MYITYKRTVLLPNNTFLCTSFTVLHWYQLLPSSVLHCLMSTKRHTYSKTLLWSFLEYHYSKFLFEQKMCFTYANLFCFPCNCPNSIQWNPQFKCLWRQWIWTLNWETSNRSPTVLFTLPNIPLVTPSYNNFNIYHA